MPALSSVQRGSPNSLSRSVGGAARREAVEGEDWRPGEVVREEWFPGGDDEEGE